MSSVVSPSQIKMDLEHDQRVAAFLAGLMQEDSSTGADPFAAENLGAQMKHLAAA